MSVTLLMLTPFRAGHSVIVLHMKLVVVRIALLLLFALAAAALTSWLAGAEFSLALTPQLAALYFIPANVINLWLLTRGRQGPRRSLLQLMDFDRSRLGRDVLLGLLYQLLLFVPFGLAINLVMLLLYGPANMFAAFETIFVPPESSTVELPLWFAWFSAIAIALLFPITNAPAEELTYRGHAQTQLRRKGWALWAAISVPSLAFGLQHIMLAATVPGMLVYAAAFTVWGAGAGLIYARTGRLMPVVIAHLLTNLFTAAAPLIILFVVP